MRRGFGRGLGARRPGLHFESRLRDFQNNGGRFEMAPITFRKRLRNFSALVPGAQGAVAERYPRAPGAAEEMSEAPIASAYAHLAHLGLACGPHLPQPPDAARAE